MLKIQLLELFSNFPLPSPSNKGRQFCAYKNSLFIPILCLPYASLKMCSAVPWKWKKNPEPVTPFSQSTNFCWRRRSGCRVSSRDWLSQRLTEARSKHKLGIKVTRGKQWRLSPRKEHVTLVTFRTLHRHPEKDQAAAAEGLAGLMIYTARHSYTYCTHRCYSSTFFPSKTNQRNQSEL